MFKIWLNVCLSELLAMCWLNKDYNDRDTKFELSLHHAATGHKAFQCAIDPPTAARRLLAEDGACLLELTPGLPSNLSEVFVTAQAPGHSDVARLRLAHIVAVKLVPRDASSTTLKRLVPGSLNISSCSTTGCASVTCVRDRLSSHACMHV